MKYNGNEVYTTEEIAKISGYSKVQLGRIRDSLELTTIRLVGKEARRFCEENSMKLATVLLVYPKESFDKIMAYCGKAEEKFMEHPTDMQCFTSEFGSVRVEVIDGEIWFVGKDVALALEYSNPQEAVRYHVDDCDKQVLHEGEKNAHPMNNPAISTGTVLINESGMYSLVFSSKLPKAKEFKHWVTAVILPSIRKNGAYIASPAFSQFSPQLQALIAIETKQKEQDQRIESVEAQMKEMLALVSRPMGADWREQCNEILRTLCRAGGYQRAYKELERTAHVNLGTRVNNIKERMRNRGVNQTYIEEINALDAIAQDDSLKTLFCGIVQRMGTEGIVNEIH